MTIKSSRNSRIIFQYRLAKSLAKLNSNHSLTSTGLRQALFVNGQPYTLRQNKKSAMIYYIIYSLISPISKKRLFGKDYIFFDEYVMRTIALYSIGATLGYIYRDKISTLLQLMTEEKSKIGDQIIALQKMAHMRYEEMPSGTKNFSELILGVELPQLMKSFYKSKIIAYESVNDFPKVSKKKIPTEYALYALQPTLYQAIGFGINYPKVTEKFLTLSLDREEWDLARKSGLDIPEHPDDIDSFDQQQENVKEMIRPYVHSKRPDLVSSLDLD
jgi:hypothetical protein